jgi:hypothetical protein
MGNAGYGKPLLVYQFERYNCTNRHTWLHLVTHKYTDTVLAVFIFLRVEQVERFEHPEH